MLNQYDHYKMMILEHHFQVVEENNKHYYQLKQCDQVDDLQYEDL